MLKASCAVTNKDKKQLIMEILVESTRWLLLSLFPDRVFVEGGKPECLEKNPQSNNEKQQQTQPTYDTGTGN